MGALTTALFIFYMLAAPLTGWLGDRFPRKPLIIAGAVLWSLATLATVWVHGYWTFYIRQAFVGIGEATFGIFAPAVLADFYPERERNRILSIFYVAIPVGAALGYLAGGQLSFGGAGAGHSLSAPFPASSSRRSMDYGAASPSAAPATTSGPPPIAPPFSDSSATPPFSPPPSAWPPSPSPWAASPTGCRSFCTGMSGLSVANASLVVGGITVVDGIAGTLIGGWIAQRWLRTNHRALYLLSFWSVALTLPCGVLLFFGPAAWAVPSLFAAEFFLFLNTGPLNAAIVNSVSAPVRATAISINLFVIHCFGDTFSPQIIGAISDHSNLSIGLGSTLIFLVISCVILWKGARHAPPMENLEISVL